MYLGDLLLENTRLIFDDAKQVIVFLEEQIFYAVENCYIAHKDMKWIITICHEEDMHISGKKEFVDEFKKNFLADMKPV